MSVNGDTGSVDKRCNLESVPSEAAMLLAGEESGGGEVSTLGDLGVRNDQIVGRMLFWLL